MGRYTIDNGGTGTQQLGGSTPACYELVCQYFDVQSTDVATVEDLTAYIRDQHSSDVEEAQVQIRLHHLILPKLADEGLIEYDARSNTARYRGETQQEQAQAPRWVPEED